MSEPNALKILIVEDGVGVRRLIRGMLASLTADFFECCDGVEGLAAYPLYRPDFVLMDIQMPVMDGITATQRIKALDAAARIVIVTDYDQADLREAASSAGACAYVLKENLLELVQLLETGLRSDQTASKKPDQKGNRHEESKTQQ